MKKKNKKAVISLALVAYCMFIAAVFPGDYENEIAESISGAIKSVIFIFAVSQSFYYSSKLIE